MRRTALLFLLRNATILVFATPLLAADEPWRVSVMRVQHGFSAAMAYAPRPAWEVEASMSEQSYDQLATINGPAVPGLPAFPVTVSRHYTVHPVDVFVTRHLDPEARLSPYVRAGARYVAVPADRYVTFFSPIGIGGIGILPTTYSYQLHNRASAEAGVGARLALTSRTALRVEVTRLLRSEGAQFDPLTRAAGGLSWHF